MLAEAIIIIIIQEVDQKKDHAHYIHQNDMSQVADSPMAQAVSGQESLLGVQNEQAI